MLLAAALLLTAGAWAQKTHTGYYLYHGKRVEVPVNSEVALAYFRTAQMDTAAIHRRYQCLKEVSLAADKADTLYACEVQLPEGTYEEGVAWLKAQPEVWDVEPVIGTTERVPVSNMFFVKLHEQSDAALLAEAAAQVGARHEGPVLPGDLWHALSVDKHSAGDALALSTQLGESGKFADVDPGFAYQVQFNNENNCPGDDWLTLHQWNMLDMDLCYVWEAGIKGAGIKVALIDNGVRTTHQEFGSMNVAGSYNAHYPYGGPAIVLGFDADSAHATMIAGLIFSDHNNEKIAGIAPEASLVNVSFARPDDTYCDAIVQSAHRAFCYAVDTAHSDVILCAWDYHAWNLSSSILDADLTRAMKNGRYGKGAVVVFAAGYSTMDQDTNILYPANHSDSILVVGGLYNTFTPIQYSRHGAELDVMAPGSPITTTYISPYSDYTEGASGSSFAAAQVAGLAALLLSYDTMLTREQVDWAIKRSTIKTSDYTYGYSPTHIAGTWHREMGYGKVNALAAKQAVDALAVTQSTGLIIKDHIMDFGKEPTSMSASVSSSPSIRVLDPNTGLETTYLTQGNTYQVKVMVHNMSSRSALVSPSDINVYWTTKLSNLRWTGSLENCGCSNVYCDHVTATGSYQTIPANGSKEFTANITVHRDPLQSCPEIFPRSLDIIAMVGNGAGIDGYAESNFHMEGFVRGNNLVAWRSGYLLDEPGLFPPDDPPFPPFGINAITPNPASGSTTVEYQTDGNRGEVQVWLTDAYGNILRRELGNNGQCSLDLQGLTPGHYYVHLIADGNRMDTRVLIIN